MLRIRPFVESDWPALLAMLQSTFAAGDVCAFSPDSPQDEIRRAWIDRTAATFVAEDEAGRALGTYYLKPNQPGLGDHVCNAGYVVAPDAQGRGIASAMCEHSQAQAVAMGFRAMQFNLVVATNERAVRLWGRHGFATVGRLPGAFRHRSRGYVDALVMFKTLVEG